MSNTYEVWGKPGLAGHGHGGARSSGNSVAWPTDARINSATWRKRFTRRLAISDTVLLVVIATILWFALPVPTPIDLAMNIASMVVLLLALTLMRTRTTEVIGIGVREYKRVVDATALSAGLVAVGIMIFEAYDSRQELLIFYPTSLVLLLASRWLWRRWLLAKASQGYALSQVLVVGCAEDISYVVRQLRKNAEAAYKVVGLLADQECNEKLVSIGVPVHQGLDSLERAVEGTGADSVVVAGPLEGGNTALKDLSWRLERTRTNLVVVSSLTNVAGPRISTRPVEGLPLMHVEMPSFVGGHHLVKRVMDIILSAIALICLAPVFGVLALLVSRDSAGPVFFSQVRVGQHGKTFRMYKFRSMVVNAEAELERLKELNEGNGVLFKMREDPRVTRVGTWLRKYSLDELPQIYNVLRGDMSLVGPRPPLPSEVEEYRGHTGRRLFIKPGLTGLWQINGRSDLDWEESVRLDLYYVENWSVTGDLMIMWRTFKVMLKPEGAY